ncbi:MULTISPECIES: sulfite exporter TauE/SafE family protein [unclassified Shinella]|uniref:sulfite exporter TauE/SafE family protein n=1 Tax=unclassified Shinella TaxID=2643062 RepID=UPI00225CCC18|nr:MULTISPECIES: sulfite exporter TauE/SafE family protein [unclassified Shinella]CAI0335838.1 putative membrane transporter protein [Rhizobiaceae bacterium]CAK7262413.1 TauE/SafE system, low molecular weight anion export [Shinella sp. WSC3-e]MDC7260397.1 sulfite exporter TauE/SafE family protein [Shinella sp. YE25]MDC7267249.1 sulfite exporter TauE/SafE family protein [Shinella sp. HY16]MDC7274132.1 sulfite exporter TauE/SafE family protein [Shinella sp. YZ44]
MLPDCSLFDGDAVVDALIRSTRFRAKQVKRIILVRKANAVSGNLLVLSGLVIFIAAFVQGATGLGFALIAAPVIGLINPQLLPVLILVLMIPLNLFVAWRERRAVDVKGAAWIMAGRVAGTAGGLWLLLAIPLNSLNLLVGVSTILAASASLIVSPFKPGSRALIAVGAITGVTETATGIGGPPLALAYQHRPAPVLRSTIATCFLLGEILSLVVLAASGQIDGEQIRIALLLLPVLGLGVLLSSLVHHRIDGPLVRTLVLAFALLSGIVVTIRGW